MGLSDANRFLGSRIRTQIPSSVFNDALTIPEVVTPAIPSNGFVKFYAKADNRIYMLDDTGRETMLEVPLNVIDTVIVDASTFVSGTWKPIIPVTSALARRIQIFDTSGNPISWSINAVPVSPKFLSGAGTNETMDIEIPAGALLSAKIDETGPFVGQIIVNLLG
jgi:hypothetical protein